MNTKNPTISIRMLQIIVVFILSALISQTSFAAKNACDMKRLSQEAKLFNNNIDPDLQVSINVDKCRMTLVGRNCAITPFNSYQLTTLPRLPDQSMLQALKIQSFGPNTEGNGYILAIPKCAG